MRHALEARQHTQNVIISTWETDNIQELELHDKLRKSGFSLVVTKDPNSIIAYTEGSVSKPFNVSRQTIGCLNGVYCAKYKYTIKTRTDLSINFSEFFDRWQKSKRACASLNITTVAPRRLFAPPFLYHVSDWCVGAETSQFLVHYNKQINEKGFERSTPCRINGTLWNVRLSAEQVLARLVTGENPEGQGENKISFSKYTSEELQLDKRIKSNFANIERKGLDFFSSKYRARANKWIMHDDVQFKDDRIMKSSLFQLGVYILSRSILLYRSKIS